MVATVDNLASRCRTILDLAVLGLSAVLLGSGTGELVSMSLVAPATAGAERRARRPRRRPPTSPKSRFHPVSKEVICGRNVFDYTSRPCELPEDGPEEEPAVAETNGVPALCDEPARVVATMASTDPGWAFAMIAAQGKTMPYRAGDAVPGLGDVRQVGWRLVLVDRPAEPDCLLDLLSEPETSVAPTTRGRQNRRGRRSARSPRRNRLDKALREGIQVVSATERNVARSLVDQVMDEPQSLVRRVRVRPHKQNGAVRGFRLSRIRRNSPLGKLGIRNGDVVTAVNGIEITSPESALRAYTKLRRASRLTVSVIRGGRPLNLDFNIR